MKTVPEMHNEPGIQKKPGQSVEQQKEDKSIILYVLNKIKIGCTREQLVDIILRNIQFNYFDLQAYIDELIDDGLMTVSSDAKDRKILLLSPEGRNTINEVFTFVPSYIRELINFYIEKNQTRLRNRITVNAEFFEVIAGDYEAALSLYENDLRLIELKINAPTEKDARELCKKWKMSYQQVYADIIQCFN